MRRFLTLCLFLTLFATFTAGCSGSAGRDPHTTDGLPVVSSVGNNGENTPGTGPTCAGQGYTGTYPACDCPEPYQTYAGLNGGCVGNPPAPTCPAGQSLTGYGAQCCPTGDTGNGTQCFVPVPAVCSSNEYGTPPDCQPIPSCSAVVGGFWGGAACECPAGQSGTYPACAPPACPAGDTGTYPNCVAPPTCDAVTGAYWGGAACECPTGTVGAYPSCIAQSSIAVTLAVNMDPQTVVDDSQGVTGATEATLSWSVSSNVPGDSILCTVDDGTPTLGRSTTVGPFGATQDGSAVAFTVACKDLWNVTASAATSVTVVAPPQAPPDVFSGYRNNDGTYTFEWYSYGGQGCYVLLASESGAGPYATPTQLTPGGGTSGNSTTAVLSPAYGPYLAQLYCGGIPDPGVPSITVSP